VLPNPSVSKVTRSRGSREPRSRKNKKMRSRKNKKMEMIMSTISNAPAPQGLPGQSLFDGPMAALKRWWMAYLT
jgi:hypothetical protein